MASTIPTSRADLLKLVATEFGNLQAELEDCLESVGNAICVDDWTVKELLAVRLWWTRSVLDWVEAGKQGLVPETPAPGYRWQETPRLNNEVAKQARGQSPVEIWQALTSQKTRLDKTIEDLTDRELLDKGVFEWAGNYPIARWLSLNTARQYKTARKYIRSAKKARGLPMVTRRT